MATLPVVEITPSVIAPVIPALFSTDTAVLPEVNCVGMLMPVMLGFWLMVSVPPTSSRTGKLTTPVKLLLLSLALVLPMVKLPPTVFSLAKAAKLVGLPVTLKSRIIRLPVTSTSSERLHRSVMGSRPGASVPVPTAPLPSMVRLPVILVYLNPPLKKALSWVCVLKVWLPVTLTSVVLTSPQARPSTT